MSDNNNQSAASEENKAATNKVQIPEESKTLPVTDANAIPNAV